MSEDIEEIVAEILRLRDKHEVLTSNKRARIVGRQLLTLLPQGPGSELNADRLDNLHAEEIIEKAIERFSVEKVMKRLKVGGGGGLAPHALNYHSDVNAGSPSDGQMLVYNAATEQWINADPLVTIDRKGTAYEINVSASGNVGPTVGSGKKLIIYGYNFSVDADMKARLKWGSTGDIIASTRGTNGMNLLGIKEEGPEATQAYIEIVSGTGNVEGRLYAEVVDA